MFLRHFLHGNDAGLLLVKLLHHLLQHRWLTHHQIVGQQHGEGRITDEPLTTQNGVAQPQSLGLTNIDALHVLRLHLAHHIQKIMLVRLLQRHFQFESEIEVIFNRPLVAPRDKHHLPHTGGVSLFHRVLDQRLVHHGQHFLGLRLGGWQKTGAETGNREDGFGDGHRAYPSRANWAFRRSRLEPKSAKR